MKHSATTTTTACAAVRNVVDRAYHHSAVCRPHHGPTGRAAPGCNTAQLHLPSRHHLSTGLAGRPASWRQSWKHSLPQWTRPPQPTRSGPTKSPHPICQQQPDDSLYLGRHASHAASESLLFQCGQAMGKPECFCLLWVQRRGLAHECNMPLQENGTHGWILPHKLHGEQVGQPPVLQEGNT